jgi:hypothetical protein
MRRNVTLLALPLLWAALVGAGCRSKPSSPGNAPDSGPAVTAESIRGWWVAGNGGEGATGYWFAADAVRILRSDHAERRLVQKASPEAGTLRIVLEGSPALVVSSREGGLTLRLGDDKPVEVRRATDAEERDLEKRDARALVRNARACERASACCRALVGKGSASSSECEPLTNVKEIGQCVRALEVFAQKASAAKLDLPECALATPTSAAPSP